ncbi:hypothetical protein C2G38_1576321 [Gigaspora rosea]|uniref:Mid2 domain-containing protein n=1 Tax=Gigaspora rosea TaxID=44941 RepID=A0A397W0B3_9GLOM|nr:hypothetical protein C2G38_1576321 [Gigaspora rosea]
MVLDFTVSLRDYHAKKKRHSQGLIERQPQFQVTRPLPTVRTTSPEDTVIGTAQTPITNFANAPNRTPTNAPNRTPTNAPNRTPANAPNRTPTNAPTNTPTNTPTRTPNIAPTSTPAITPIIASTIAPIISRSIFPSPSATSNSNASNPDASKENASNTNFVSPVSPDNDSGNNDNSTAKYIIIGVSGVVGIVLIVSILFIFKKLRANRLLKHKNNNSRNSRGFNTGFGNGNSNVLRNISHSSQQGTTSYKDGPIQSYNASYGSGLYPTRNPYLVGSDYSGRSNSTSSTGSNYYGYNGNNFQSYNVQNYNSQLSPPPNQYYNSNMNIVTNNFLPVGGIDRRMVRENIMEIANEEDSTQENIGNYNIPVNNTFSTSSERDSEQESFRLSLLNEYSRNSRTSSTGDNRSQTSQRPIYF